MLRSLQVEKVSGLRAEHVRVVEENTRRDAVEGCDDLSKLE